VFHKSRATGSEPLQHVYNNPLKFIDPSGKFDAVIDLDAAVRDPANPTGLLLAYDTGDHLHLDVAGYQKMTEAIDLDLFK